MTVTPRDWECRHQRPWKRRVCNFEANPSENVSRTSKSTKGYVGFPHHLMKSDSSYIIIERHKTATLQPGNQGIKKPWKRRVQFKANSSENVSRTLSAKDL